MDAKYINPILTSMVNVLSTMAQLQPKSGRPILKTDDKAKGVVTGLMEFKGKEAMGSMAISFPLAVILDIARRMLHEEKTEVDDTIKDLTGEITNMVLGGAKALFAEQGYDFGMTLPEVLTGDNHIVKHSVSGPTIILPFSVDAGEFFVEICFE